MSTLKLSRKTRVVNIYRFKYHGTIWDDSDIESLISYYQSGMEWEKISIALFRKPSACRSKMYQLRAVKRNAAKVESVDLSYSRKARKAA